MSRVVIFDMDGVIIDSEPIYGKVYSEIFDKLNVDISVEERNSFVGFAADRVWTYVRAKGNISKSINELIQMQKDTYFEYLKSTDNFKHIEGVSTLIDELKNRKFIISLASSAQRRVVDFVLDKINMKNYFSFVLSGEDVKNGKPEPEIFLKVAERFKVKTSDCIVIEDSMNGVAAAKAAGMKCIGYKNPNSGSQDISKADLIIDDFSSQSVSRIIELLNY